MADRLGRMQVAAEVPPFEGKVGGDKHFTAGRRAQNRAIVADAERDRLVAGSEIAANLLDQGQLSQRIEQFCHLESRIYGRRRMVLLWELRDDPMVTVWLREGTQFVTLTEDAHERIAVLE